MTRAPAEGPRRYFVSASYDDEAFDLMRSHIQLPEDVYAYDRMKIIRWFEGNEASAFRMPPHSVCEV